MGCYKTEPKGKSARNRAIYNPDKVRWSEGGEEGKTERGRQPLMPREKDDRSATGFGADRLAIQQADKALWLSA